MATQRTRPAVGESLLDELRWRGLVQDVSDAESLNAALAAGPMTLYAGYDPTASSLHVGNLQIILLLRRFQLAGHRIIALSGGGTGLIGDPSGKTGERALRDVVTVRSWTAAIRAQLEQLLPAGDDVKAPLFLDNVDWISELGAVELLRDLGKHFPLSYMLSKDSVASRLGEGAAGMSFTEFSYMVLQAYDFGELYERHNCRLQVGGSDQWGNITAGLELLRRTNRPGAFGLTSPLIVREDGTKFGKSEQGAVWLDRARTAPFAFYQYFINVPDADVGTLLRRLSLRPPDEILELEEETERSPAERRGQRALAEELTELVHGTSGLDEALEITDWLFHGGQLREGRDILEAVAGAPSVDVSPETWAGWEPVLVEAGLASSRSDARRAISGGGIYISDRRIAAAERQLDMDDFEHGGIAILRKGKRHRAMLRLADARQD